MRLLAALLLALPLPALAEMSHDTCPAGAPCPIGIDARLLAACAGDPEALTWPYLRLSVALPDPAGMEAGKLRRETHRAVRRAVLALPGFPGHGPDAPTPPNAALRKADEVITLEGLGWGGWDAAALAAAGRAPGAAAEVLVPLAFGRDFRRLRAGEAAAEGTGGAELAGIALANGWPVEDLPVHCAGYGVVTLTPADLRGAWLGVNVAGFGAAAGQEWLCPVAPLDDPAARAEGTPVLFDGAGEAWLLSQRSDTRRLASLGERVAIEGSVLVWGRQAFVITDALPGEIRLQPLGLPGHDVTRPVTLVRCEPGMALDEALGLARGAGTMDTAPPPDWRDF